MTLQTTGPTWPLGHWATGPLAVLCCLLINGCATAQESPNPTDRTERFFQHCRSRSYVSLHEPTSAWDPHQLLYTLLAVSELEVVRVIDWVLDLPIPGRSIQPLRHGAQRLRRGYHRLPSWQIITRLGELVEALQLPELSVGDANATYTVAMGGTAGPGSGMVVRTYKLIDWTQHVVGDVNRGLGRWVRRPHGLIPWGVPDYGIDAIQWMLLKTFNATSMLVTRSVDGALTVAEIAGEQLVNLGYRRPHAQTTVFLRMPIGVYRAHELWFLEHQHRLRVIRPAQLTQETHASLLHRGRFSPLPAWVAADVPGAEVPELVVVMHRRVLARAPRALHAYVVPAAWVLDQQSPSEDVSPSTRPNH